MAFGLNRPRPSSGTIRLLLRREQVVGVSRSRTRPGSTTDDKCQRECSVRPIHGLVPPVHRSFIARRDAIPRVFSPSSASASGRVMVGRTGSGCSGRLRRLARRDVEAHGNSVHQGVARVERVEGTIAGVGSSQHLRNPTAHLG